MYRRRQPDVFEQLMMAQQPGEMMPEGIYTKTLYGKLKTELRSDGWKSYINHHDVQVDDLEECPYCNSPISFHEGFKRAQYPLEYRCFAVCSCGAAFEF